VQEYQNARHNPYAQMRNVDLSVEKACQIEGINRYIADGLRLKTFDCSQITDGYAGSSSRPRKASPASASRRRTA